jgi:hypothetical protein
MDDNELTVPGTLPIGSKASDQARPVAYIAIARLAPTTGA